jgi:hypothetical protein
MQTSPLESPGSRVYHVKRHYTIILSATMTIVLSRTRTCMRTPFAALYSWLPLLSTLFALVGQESGKSAPIKGGCSRGCFGGISTYRCACIIVAWVSWFSDFALLSMFSLASCGIATAFAGCLDHANLSAKIPFSLCSGGKKKPRRVSL